MSEFRFDNDELTGGARAVNLDGIETIETEDRSSQNQYFIYFVPREPYKRSTYWEYDNASDRDAAYSALKTNDFTERT
jgi:hypothetical protein